MGVDVVAANNVRRGSYQLSLNQVPVIWSGIASFSTLLLCAGGILPNTPDQTKGKLSMR